MRRTAISASDAATVTAVVCADVVPNPVDAGRAGWKNLQHGDSAFAAARAIVEIGWAVNGLFFLTLFGIGFGLYGVALALDGRYGRLGGAVIPLAAVSVLVGIVEIITGARIALVYVQNALMTLTLIWVAYSGVRLWRDGTT